MSLASYTATYAIPYKTPFELIGPTAVDSVADTATLYCWAQSNLGDFGARLVNTYTRGPIFRSYQPVYTPTRIFPRISMVLTGNLSNAGTEGAEGEKAPDTARFLTFRMTVRNILNGKGCILVPDDTIHLDVVSNSTKRGFKVTSQGTTGVSYAGGSTQTVTWDVANTTASPVNAANVNIYMSTDGGLTWPYTVGTFSNTGTASVVVPNPAVTSGLCRFKVKGAGNVFFNLNMKNFTVTHNSSIPTTGVQPLQTIDQVKVYPVPATTFLNVEIPAQTTVMASLYNTVGQLVWQGKLADKTTIDVSAWAKGVYYLNLQSDNAISTRKLVIE
ncbi:MAG: T9SS C-terminal target domain-containing protein [Chitinophagia bacterium]|nr:T9SS C-terminal target domain-containing protein [Chitinophagia bacterium]